MTRQDATGPRPLAEAINRLITERGLAAAAGRETLTEIWSAAAGPEVASRTRVMGLKNGTLEIGVTSSALLNELVGFHNQAILDAIQADERGGRIRRIRFRLNRQAGHNERGRRGS